jgi:molybdopterin biosynthesis enzyme MoaB
MFLIFEMKNILHPALVRALVSSIDQSLIITAPGQRQTVYETLNKIAELLLSGSLEKTKQPRVQLNHHLLF